MFGFKANCLMKYFNEISERKPFNVTLVLILEISMKFQRKANFDKTPFLYVIFKQPFESSARTRNQMDARLHLNVNSVFSSKQDDSFNED
jgi:hypothetical protein